MEESIFNMELGKKVLALIKACFKVADLIPDMFLREKIKNQILNVYELFFKKHYPELLKEIDLLSGLFFLAGQMDFVKENHLRVLKNGFLVFKSRIVLALNESSKISKDPISPQTAVQPVLINGSGESDKVVKKEPVKPEIRLSKRQEKIMEKFNDNETLKLAEIKELFPGISERTIRNEMSSLVELKKITRTGQGSGSLYKIVRQ